MRSICNFVIKMMTNINFLLGLQCKSKLSFLTCISVNMPLCRFSYLRLMAPRRSPWNWDTKSVCLHRSEEKH